MGSDAAFEGTGGFGGGAEAAALGREAGDWCEDEAPAGLEGSPRAHSFRFAAIKAPAYVLGETGGRRGERERDLGW